VSESKSLGYSTKVAFACRAIRHASNAIDCRIRDRDNSATARTADHGDMLEISCNASTPARHATPRLRGPRASASA
jgi:hypothetical protein